MKFLIALCIVTAAVGAERLMPTPEQIYKDELADVEVRCLTQALYFEARSEEEKSQRAVAEVVLNRRDAHPYGSFLVCDVVSEPGQFSWFHGWPMKPGDMDIWWKLYPIAQDELMKRTIDKPVHDQLIPLDYRYFCSGECTKNCKGSIIGTQCYYRGA